MIDKQFIKLSQLFFGGNIQVAKKVSKQTRLLNKKNKKTLKKIGRIT